MNLTDAIAKYVLGMLPVDHLPTIAMDAMEAGHDSPSLRQLAGSQGCDRDEIAMLFAETLDELGEHIPSAPDAGLLLAKMIAREVLQGAISPYEGAKRIWDVVYVRFPHLSQLAPFVGLASEYEDDDKHRQEYSRRITERCQALLSGV